MKIGLISDVHNNIAALNKALAHFSDENCGAIICCGDILGIGAYPEETVRTIMAIPNLVLCVRGNHEDYLKNPLPATTPNPQGMKRGEIDYHKWEHERLSPESKEFLNSLPINGTLTVNSKKIFACHYAILNGVFLDNVVNPTPKQIKKMFYNIDADIIIYGHEHRQYITDSKRSIYINPGSLGCPGEMKNIAYTGILEINDDNNNYISYSRLELEYDIEPTLAKIEELNFPAKDVILKLFYGY